MRLLFIDEFFRAPEAPSLCDLDMLCHDYFVRGACVGVASVKWSRLSFLVADCLYSLPRYPVNQLRIWQACFPGCEGEVLIVGENRIRVCLDEIEFVFGCQAQIDARVAVNCQ